MEIVIETNHPLSFLINGFNFRCFQCSLHSLGKYCTWNLQQPTFPINCRRQVIVLSRIHQEGGVVAAADGCCW